MRFYWNDRKMGRGIHELITGQNGYASITLYDIQAFRQIEAEAGKPLFAYSGIMPDGVYHSMSSLKARNVENAKMEVLKIYKRKLKEENAQHEKCIRENEETLKELELLIQTQRDKREDAQE